jgi:hypothetical protein
MSVNYDTFIFGTVRRTKAFGENIDKTEIFNEESVGTSTCS